MTRTHWLVVAAIAFILTAGGAPASAQGIGLTADIPFSFTAAGKTMPAGIYNVEKQSTGLLLIRSEKDPKAQAELTVMTRLAQRMSPADPGIVFDKVGNQDYLSEVWLANEDGYLVFATKGEHTHYKVRARK